MSGYTTFVVNVGGKKKSTRKPGRKKRTGTGVRKKKATQRYVGAHGVLFDSLSAAMQSKAAAKKAKNMAKPRKTGIALKSLARQRLTEVMTEDFTDMAYEAGETAGVSLTGADISAVEAAARLPTSTARQRSLKKALAAISKRGSVPAAPVRRRKKKSVAKKSGAVARRAILGAAKKTPNAGRKFAPGQRPNVKVGDNVVVHVEGRKAPFKGRVTDVRPHGVGIREDAPLSRAISIVPRPNGKLDLVFYSSGREFFPGYVKSIEKISTKAKNMAKKKKSTKKRKFSPAQLAAQKRFAEMSRARAAARKKKGGFSAEAARGIGAAQVKRSKAAAKKKGKVYGLGAAMTKDVQKALDASRKMAKASFVDKKRADEAEKKLRSCRARVGAARKRGDLTKLEEERLKKKLELARAALRRCAAKAAKKVTKKKTKKRAKKKVTKRKKKVTKKKAKKKVTKKRVTKKKVVRKKRKKLTGSKRVSTKVAAKRKKAQPKKCPTGKKRPVKCKTRPTKIEMDACTQAARRHKKSPSRTCGPGVPRGKTAAAEMGKRKAEIEKRRKALKRKQISEFMRGG